MEYTTYRDARNVRESATWLDIVACKRAARQQKNRVNFRHIKDCFSTRATTGLRTFPYVGLSAAPGLTRTDGRPTRKREQPTPRKPSHVVTQPASAKMANAVPKMQPSQRMLAAFDESMNERRSMRATHRSIVAEQSEIALKKMQSVKNLGVRVESWDVRIRFRKRMCPLSIVPESKSTLRRQVR